VKYTQRAAGVANTPKDFFASFAGFSHCGLCAKKLALFEYSNLCQFLQIKKPHRVRQGYIRKKGNSYTVVPSLTAFAV
jgi:hypothetical protein